MILFLYISHLQNVVYGPSCLNYFKKTNQDGAADRARDKALGPSSQADRDPLSSPPWAWPQHLLQIHVTTVIPHLSISAIRASGKQTFI